MATRLDRVTNRASRLDETVDLAPTALVPRQNSQELAPSYQSETWHLPAAAPKALPAPTLGGAMAAWLSLTFGLCYVVLPSIVAIAGWNTGVIASFWYSLPAFAMASFAAIVGTMAAQPSVQLDLARPRDPVIAATLGGLGVWAVVHNTSSFLVPFTAMGPLELATFLGMNVIEMSLLGMMFASFTKRTSTALALGGGFQLITLGLALTLMALL